MTRGGVLQPSVMTRGGVAKPPVMPRGTAGCGGGPPPLELLERDIIFSTSDPSVHYYLLNF